MIFNQWEDGKDTQGNSVGFDNVKNNPDFGYGYYYGNGKEANRSEAAYPMYYNKYVGGGDEGGAYGGTPGVRCDGGRGADDRRDQNSHPQVDHRQHDGARGLRHVV